MVRVSVIIPTYNRSKSIGRAIQSVLNQTYSDFEIIVIDDNSSDDTKNIVSYYMNIDSRVRYIKHNTNLGGPAARNTGLKNSIGEFIGLLDDDDEWLPKKLEKQVELFDNSSKNLGLAYSGYEIINTQGKVVLKNMPTKKGYLFYEFLEANLIGSPTNLVRRDCFDKIGYCDEDLVSCQDQDLWIRISQQYEVNFVPEILARYYLSEISISTNIESSIIGHKQLLFKYENYIKQNPKIHSKHLKDIGLLYQYNNDVVNSNKFLKMAMQTYPFNWKAIINYLFIKIFRNPIGHYLGRL